MKPEGFVRYPTKVEPVSMIETWKQLAHDADQYKQEAEARADKAEARVKVLEELCGLVASTAHVAFKPDDGFVIPSDVVRRCGRAWRGEPLDT